MRSLRKKYNAFLLRNRSKGIPNLMLWIGLANLAVYLIVTVGETMASGSAFSNAAANLYDWLYYDATRILQGEVWRAFTFLFTYITDSTAGYGLYGILLAALNVYFYHWLGQILEQSWGPLRFNIYYLSGVLMMSLAGIVVELFAPGYGQIFGHSVSAYYVNISLFIAVATMIPDQQVYLFMFIPIKMRWMALIDLILTALQMYTGVMTAIAYGSHYNSLAFFLVGMVYAQFPLLELVNYFLHFGRNVSRLFRRSTPRPRPVQAVPNPAAAQSGTNRSYRHKCTVCGRTDTEFPDLEFRYCSKCKGYFCYCIDHIGNHTHIT